MNVIKLDHISKTFGSEEAGVHAVRDVTLQIAPGEIFGIIGYSGAGKSTLVRCINLLEKPTAGTVTVDGQELTRMPARELRQARKKISMIFQLFNLMPSRTVAENVAFPLKGSGLSKEETKAKVNELLELVDLPDKAEAYPSQLSGGQKQRVAIAGVIAMTPRCIILDEPTAMLDPQGRREVMEAIKKLNQEQGITIILITHYMEEAAQADRVVVMNDGRILLDGTPREVFSHVQELKDVGLDVPQATELCWRLRQEGCNLPEGILTEEECAQALAQLLEVGPHACH